MFDPDSPARAEAPDEFGSFEFYKDETFYKQERWKDLGLSHYDVRRDGSAVVFSSAKRPLLNNRPDYVNWTGHRPRELSAELIMIGFMDKLGIAFDVLTDHDLHIKAWMCWLRIRRSLRAVTQSIPPWNPTKATSISLRLAAIPCTWAVTGSIGLRPWMPPDRTDWKSAVAGKG
jgi:hypothetical protein